MVILPLPTRLIKPNFCFDLSHRRSTTVSLETRNSLAKLTYFIIILSVGIGTVAFNTRLGLYQDPPPDKALKFIEAVDTFFIQTQKMLNLPSAMMRQYIDTPALKKFFKAADDIVDIGEYFISNKMKELKEMTEKGIEVSDEGKKFIAEVHVVGWRELKVSGQCLMC